MEETFENKYGVYNMVYNATKSGKLVWERIYGVYTTSISGYIKSEDDTDDNATICALSLTCYRDGLEIFVENNESLKYYVPNNTLYTVITNEWMKQFNSKMDGDTFNKIKTVFTSF